MGIDLGTDKGCAHYDTSKDIVAIQFKCCGRYYACFKCHEALADHAPKNWLAEEYDRYAILCRKCSALISISEYQSVSGCPRCCALFNPRCQLHWDVYF
ncbi:MAG: CHY zinc finger protein [Pseudomonadota bacterium]